MCMNFTPQGAFRALIVLAFATKRVAYLLNMIFTTVETKENLPEKKNGKNN